jgi:hypothetical protein
MKAKLYNRFPISSILIYNSSTIIHFVIGSLILAQSRHFLGNWGVLAAYGYLILALVEMYVVMPYKVCVNCVYFRLENGVCVSGLNVVAQRFFTSLPTQDLTRRARGLLCPNNLYIGFLIFPIVVGVPLLIGTFSMFLLSMELFLFILLVVRFFIIIPRLACVHCLSKFVCPQAGQMGVREK